MKKNLQFLPYSMVVFTILFVYSLCYAAPPAAKVAVLPFKINSEKNYDFLQEGMMDMLSSRLTWQDRIEVIEKEYVKSTLKEITNFTGQSRAIMAGAKLGADYVVYGSLTIVGTNASIDAKIIDIAGEKGLLPLSKQAASINSIIPEINRFATDINKKVFNRHIARQPINPYTQGKQPGEKQFNSNFIVNNQSSASNGPNQGFIYSQQQTVQNTFWKSRSYDFLITGLDIGDVDNDGRIEAVLLSDHEVYIYRKENRKFIQTDKTAISRIYTNLSVDVADINQNGTPEIFVSTIGPDNTKIKSHILEHDGKQFKKIATHQGWYLRVVDKNSGNPLLLGQEQTKTAGPYSSPVYEMKYVNGKFTPETRVISEGRCHVFGVAYGDINGDDSKDFVTFDRKDYIRILNGNSNETWRSNRKFGGNTNYHLLPTMDPTDPGSTQFFPLRLILADTNKDNKLEVITAVNSNAAINMLQRVRSYKEGNMESLFWNGISLAEFWKTQSMRGRISDFFLGDFDDDGIIELVISIVQKQGIISFSDAKSLLIAYEL